MKRLDIAINDTAGILSIPQLCDKMKNKEYESIFNAYESIESGKMLKQETLDGKSTMGRTLYIGSKKSDIYFCVYEKDYEQFIKEHIPIEESDVKNRFEIRFKNDRAFVALMDLMEFDDVQKTACEIINRYILFLEPDQQKEMDDWEIDLRWKHFIKDCSSKLKLTLQPEPYTLDRKTSCPLSFHAEKN